MTKNNNKAKNSSRPSKGLEGSRQRTMKPSGVTPLANPGRVRVLTRARGPSARTTTNGIILSNQERILTVTGSGGISTISVGTLSMNPTTTLFPWASRALASYALYRFTRLRICFVSSVPTTTPGEIAFGGFYDLEDAAGWTTTSNPLITITQNQGTTGGPVWGSTISYDSKGMCSEIMYDVDVARAHSRTPWFRTAPANTTSNNPSYNQATLVTLGFAVTWGGSAALPVGSFWVDYEVEAIHPQIPQTTTTFMETKQFLGTLDEVEIPTGDHDFPSMKSFMPTLGFSPPS